MAATGELGTTGKPKLAVTTPGSASFLRNILHHPAPAPAPAPSAGLPSARFVFFPTSAGPTSAGPTSAGPTSAGPTSAGPTSARGFFRRDEAPQRTPITPPTAYLDFLKSMSLQSPAVASPTLEAKTPVLRDRTSTASSTASAASGLSDSAPSSASSAATDMSCRCDHTQPKALPAGAPHSVPASNTAAPAPPPLPPPRPLPADARLPPPASPLGPILAYPLSAPATGPSAAAWPSLKVSPSPSPSTAFAPAPAGPLRSPFDWGAAIKARRFAEPPKTSPAVGVRHVREVVTRTVTYTPRMGPAPKGKRRKVDHERGVES